MFQGGDLFIAVGNEPFDINDFATGVGREFCVCVSLSVCLSVLAHVREQSCVVPSVKP